MSTNNAFDTARRDIFSRYTTLISKSRYCLVAFLPKLDNILKNFTIELSPVHTERVDATPRDATRRVRFEWGFSAKRLFFKD